MSIMDDMSLQQMMSIYLEHMAHVSVVELYVEFEQIPYVVGAVEEVQPDLTIEEPSFMRVLDEEAMKEPEFAEDMNPGPTFVPGGEFAIGMEFNFRESVIKAVKEYTISRGVDYWVKESEPTTFYVQCVQHRANCAWLIRVSLIKRKFCWVVRRYNGSHTCTRGTIS
ncbi:hypothetical protein PIB30_023903 [Stylosanthes scabra]|uniref:Transposase MuDR plant domain-containing protein n=1 Tax=Stylosanthes scabra TaxID=79078 RepID=A0ABU6U8J9_9FABA|nr:hypothetical protein [Stylosanthes scabra]